MDPLEINKEQESNELDLNALSKSELLEQLKLIADKDVDEVKAQVDLIKQVFYKRYKAEVEDAKKKFLEEGGEEIDFVHEKDENEETLKALLNDFKARKATHNAKVESEKEANLLRKEHILERMKVLVESSDDVSVHVPEFRELQKQWKEIGQVPHGSVAELWKSYSSYQEAFWDLIKINNELREYDFRKNLEIKTQLCELAEKLDEESDVVSAFHQLQKFHEEWHEVGPVAREFREELWQRFKQATSVINKKHQTHFDDIRSMEDDNLTAKTAICETIEAMEFDKFASYKEWDEASKKMTELQESWRTIGFAPKKNNHKIYERFRAACDKFFESKANFYRSSKQTMVDNLEQKKALCVKAEALKDSTEWKETTDQLVAIQKEWKTIGPVPKKHSDEVWKRFIAACDYFFDQKQKHSSSQKSDEVMNLKIKKEIIANINALAVVDGNHDEVLVKLRELIAEWNNAGHVPYKEKDKLYKEYRSAIDKQFEVLNVDAQKNRLENFKTNLKDMSTKGENKLYRERDKLYRTHEHLQAEIQTYENNIGFLTANSKKGNSLIKEMERKIESLKEEVILLEQKIQLIDDQI